MDIAAPARTKHVANGRVPTELPTAKTHVDAPPKKRGRGPNRPKEVQLAELEAKIAAIKAQIAAESRPTSEAEKDGLRIAALLRKAMAKAEADQASDFRHVLHASYNSLHAYFIRENIPLPKARAPKGKMSNAAKALLSAAHAEQGT